MGGIALLVGRLRTGDWGTTPAAAKARLKERKQDKEAADPPAELASHAGSATVGNYLVLFLAWWAVAAWLSYSYAGEKMPWLMTHMAQPMTLFGGWACALLLLRIDWRKVRGAQAWWLLALLPALLFTVGTLVVAFPLGGRGVDSLARTARFILAGATTAGLLYLISLAIRRHSWGLTLRLAALAVVSLLFLLTVRFTYLLNYVNYDMATEYLVYAHASPDVKRAIQEIETISQRTVGEREIRVSYDDDVAWPMTWYMRFYPNHVFYGANPTTDAMSGAHRPGRQQKLRQGRTIRGAGLCQPQLSPDLVAGRKLQRRMGWGEFAGAVARPDMGRPHRSGTAQPLVADLLLPQSPGPHADRMAQPPRIPYVRAQRHCRYCLGSKCGARCRK